MRDRSNYPPGVTSKDFDEPTLVDRKDLDFDPTPEQVAGIKYWAKMFSKAMDKLEQARERNRNK